MQATKFRSAPDCEPVGALLSSIACKCVPPACSVEYSPAPSAHDGLLDALSAQRCVILDGATAPGEALASGDVLALHRRYVRAGCDVVTTNTRRLLSTLDDAGRPPHWMQMARRSVRLARQAIAKERREGSVAVAFSINADIDRPEEAETIGLLSRAFAGEPPDLVLVEGLLSSCAPRCTRRSRRCWRWGSPCGCPSVAVATGCAASTASTGAARRETRSGVRPGASKSSGSARCCSAASRLTTSTGCCPTYATSRTCRWGCTPISATSRATAGRSTTTPAPPSSQPWPCAGAKRVHS